MGEKTLFRESFVIYRRSLGTGIATRFSSENNPKLLLLESPFYSLSDVRMSYFPLFPFNLMMKYQFCTDLCIKKVNCPIYPFHGTKDEVIPYKFSINVAELLYKKPSEI